MNGNEPATKADLELTGVQIRSEMSQMSSDLRAEMHQMGSDIRTEMSELHSETSQSRSEMNHQYHDLVERIEDSETKLLKAFYSFAEANQKRLLETEGNEGSLRSRVGSIETRLLEVEKRLNIPPAA